MAISSYNGAIEGKAKYILKLVKYGRYRNSEIKYLTKNVFLNHL